jgi:hypothetical protein
MQVAIPVHSSGRRALSLACGRDLLLLDAGPDHDDSVAAPVREAALHESLGDDWAALAARLALATALLGFDQQLD